MKQFVIRDVQIVVIRFEAEKFFPCPDGPCNKRVFTTLELFLPLQRVLSFVLISASSVREKYLAHGGIHDGGSLPRKFVQKISLPKFQKA